MATKKDAATQAADVPATMEDILSFLSPEEMAEVLAVTGQAANLRESVPVIKVNYCTLTDKNGRTIKEGNYVIKQNSSVIDYETVDEDGEKVIEKRVEDIGIDLGKSPKVTIFCFGTKYSFFPSSESTDKGNEHICQSQLVFDSRVEKHEGSKLGFRCQGGGCPRRNKEAKKADKCSAQWVLFCEVTVDEEKIKAIMYVKGSSYIPFSDYIKSLGVLPVFCAPTKLSTKQEISEQGKPYYVQGFTFFKDKLFTQLEVKSNLQTAKETKAAAEDFKKTQASRKPAAQIAAKGEGQSAKLIENFSEDDEIVF